MKLAFNGKAHYPDYSAGYDLYSSRARSRECVDKKTYNKIIRMYCSSLADRLLNTGMADLPMNIGTIYTSVIFRRPQYRGKKFIGYGKKDWGTGYYDGDPKAFGLVFLPNRDRNANLRCYGFVSNRALFKKLKSLYQSDYCPWTPIEFNNEMI